MAKKGQKQSKYTQIQIDTVISERISDGKSVRYLSKKHGIPTGTIETWIRKYRLRGTALRKQRGRPKTDINEDYKEKYEILKKFLESLEEVE